METVFARSDLEAHEAIPYAPAPTDIQAIYEQQFQQTLKHIANGLCCAWKFRKPNETKVQYQYGFSPGSYIIYHSPVKQEWMKSHLDALFGSKENAIKIWMSQFEKAFPGFSCMGIKEHYDWSFTVTFEITE